MRKILIYRNQLLPLSETFILAQAGALRNFDVRFAGMMPMVDGLPVQYRSVLLTRHNSGLSKLARFLFMNYGFGPGFLRRLKDEKPALIHAHFSIDSSIALPIAEHLDIPLICSLHGYDITTKPRYLARTQDGRIYLHRKERLIERVTKFIPTSRYIMQRAIASGFPAEKMELVYSGLDLSKLCPGNEPRDPNLILYVGRLVEKKGGPHLLKAVAKVARHCPDVKLVIIGDGPLREALEAEARDLNINCRFLGRLMNPEPGGSVHDWMRRARVFCGPSVEASDGNTEGVPFVFVESHALGLPAVSYDHAGIKEAVLHGETGLLAPEEDIDSLAAYLVQMLTDDPFWEKCSQRAQRWVWERFDLNVLTRQLEALYNRALSSKA